MSAVSSGLLWRNWGDLCNYMFYFRLAKWLGALMRGFNPMFALHAPERDLFSRSTPGIGLAFLAPYR